MKNRTLVLLVLVFISTVQSRATELIQNVSARENISLNGQWGYSVDPLETGYYNYRSIPYEETNWPHAGMYNNQKQKNKGERIEYDFNNVETMVVPGDWNSQKQELIFYEGTVWYQKDFLLEKKEGKRYFIHFGAVNYEAFVYINGKSVGKHIGGFTPFNYEITDVVNDGENFVVVKVDNKRRKEAVPTNNFDWWNYGGITRDVNIVALDETYIQDYSFALTDLEKKEISVGVQCQGPSKAGKKVIVNIPELKLVKELQTDEAGQASFNVNLKKVQLWDTENPKLYDVEVVLGDETIQDKIGFRTIETRGTDIVLNGNPMYLRGICIHEENPLNASRAHTMGESRMLLGWAKDLSCNFVRLAHYPHNENMTRLADEMGLLVWSEIPVYWTIDWENEATYANAENQLTDMISRDKNRASVIIWSIGNETPITEPRLKFMSSLAKKAKELDSSRLTSAALELHYVGEEDPYKAVLEDPLAAYLDVMSFNEYIGWYGNSMEEIEKFTFEFKYDKPVLISELGAGALGGFNADKETCWSEEFQEEFYKHQVKLADKHDQIKGFTPWILCDFKSPKRLHSVYQDFWNRKGVISNNGKKKKAFYILKEFYDTKK